MINVEFLVYFFEKFPDFFTIIRIFRSAQICINLIVLKSVFILFVYIYLSI